MEGVEEGEGTGKKRKRVSWWFAKQCFLVGEEKEKGGRTSKHKTNPSKYSLLYPHNIHLRDRDSGDNFLRG